MCFNVIKAGLARMLFAAHAFIVVWRVVDIKDEDESYWLFTCSLVALLLEGLISICHRGGKELKWFCPSVFLYLCCVIPPIWVLELDLAEKRLQWQQDESNAKLTAGVETLPQIEGLEIGINIALPADLWPKVLEQFLVVNLILGRWLLPKGELTRDQLSQLLLVYIGMAADIVEIFESFKEDAVLKNVELTFVVLGVWSWSLLQFTIVLTSTKARKPRLGVDTSLKEDAEGGGRNKCCSIQQLYDMDMWAIMTTIVLQDGPFLCLRLVLIIHYNVVSYLNIFFTCKNSLVLLLQIYRLFVLCCEKSHDLGKPQNSPQTDDLNIESNKYHDYQLERGSSSSSKNSLHSSSKEQLIKNNSNDSDNRKKENMKYVKQRSHGNDQSTIIYGYGTDFQNCKESMKIKMIPEKVRHKSHRLKRKRGERVKDTLKHYHYEQKYATYPKTKRRTSDQYTSNNVFMTRSLGRNFYQNSTHMNNRFYYTKNCARTRL